MKRKTNNQYSNAINNPNININQSIKEISNFTDDLNEKQPNDSYMKVKGILNNSIRTSKAFPTDGKPELTKMKYKDIKEKHNKTKTLLNKQEKTTKGEKKSKTNI